MKVNKNLNPLNEAGQNNNVRVLLNSDEACQYLGIAKSTLYKHTSSGKIAFYRPNGKLIFFNREELDLWLTSKRIPTLSELKLNSNAERRGK